MKKTFFTLCIFLLSLMTVNAQLAMGKWRTHMAYSNITQVTQSDYKVYALSSGALFSVDKTDGNIEYYSKISGLNGSGISQIKFDTTNKQLLIVYSNGNIDLMTSSGVINIPDFYNNTSVAAKTVNHICFYQDKAFLSCTFGIMALNMTKKEIAESYIIGDNASEVNVLSTVINQGNIYAASASEVYTASITNPNLVNYQYWTKLAGLPGSGSIQAIGVFNNRLLLQRDSKLYINNSNAWSQLGSENINNFQTSNNKLIVNGVSNTTYVYSNDLSAYSFSNTTGMKDALYDNVADMIWLAGDDLGVISVTQPQSSSRTLSYYKPQGPAVNMPFDMTLAGNKLFVVPGGRSSSQNLTPGKVMMYENKSWTNLYSTDITPITNSSALDFMNVAVNPKDPKHFFVTSYGTGLYEFKNNSFYKWYNTTNSTLETHPNVPNLPNQYTRLDGAVYDTLGNLYIANCAVADNIKILLKDGTWTKLNTGSVQETLGKIFINQENMNQKWVLVVRAGGGIIVFDDNGTLTQSNDDKHTLLKTLIDVDGGSSITPTNCYSIAQDKDGVIWVGTEQGPLLFSNTSKVFNSDYTCTRVKIPRNDGTTLADYLLASEKIKAIAIDGANRKWLGTESSGLYLMSADGKETIKHFTSLNSPLGSNNILSLAINKSSGEVFIGTDQGLVSYQSDAADADNAFTNVYAYPNPARQNFNGIITITGLSNNTQVKITDINGNLICQTISNGSIATWDCKDSHGRKVNTGIYLAMCVSEDGTQNAIAKIMVIN